MNWGAFRMQLPGAESTRVFTRRCEMWSEVLKRRWGTDKQRRDLRKALGIMREAHGRAEGVMRKRVGSPELLGRSP